jgi:hypothetical protein
MSESSSAKEVLIEVQAAVEQLNHNMLLVDDDDDDDDDNKLQTPSAQLVTLVSLYSSGKLIPLFVSCR